MDINEITPYLIAIAGFLATFVKIPKLEINFWGFIGSELNKKLTHDVMIKLNSLSAEIDDIKNDVSVVTNNLQDHITSTRMQRIKTTRMNILNFSNDLICHKKKTLEEFNEILSYIDYYEKYFLEHTDEVNNVANLSIANIKQVYQECCANNSFLPQEKWVDN